MKECKVGIFYASISGSTKRASFQLGAKLQTAEIFNIADIEATKMLEFDLLILGSPTYGKGDLHYLWAEVLDEMKALDFQKKTIAIFCLGDQVHHGKTFAGALEKLFTKVKEFGCKIIGFLDNEGYKYESTTSLLAENLFPGLILDETNQKELTPQRIEKWVEKLEQEFAGKTHTIMESNL